MTVAPVPEELRRMAREQIDRIDTMISDLSAERDHWVAALDTRKRVHGTSNHVTRLSVHDREERVLSVLPHEPASMLAGEVARTANAGSYKTVFGILKMLERSGTILEVSGNKKHYLRWARPKDSGPSQAQDGQQSGAQDEPQAQAKPRHNRAPRSKDALTRREEVLRYLENEGPATNKDLSKVFNITSKWVNTLMQKIQDEGLVQCTPAIPIRGKSTVWSVAPREVRISAERGTVEQGRRK